MLRSPDIVNGFRYANGRRSAVARTASGETTSRHGDIEILLVRMRILLEPLEFKANRANSIHLWSHSRSFLDGPFESNSRFVRIGHLVPENIHGTEDSSIGNLGGLAIEYERGNVNGEFREKLRLEENFRGNDGVFALNAPRIWKEREECLDEADRSRRVQMPTAFKDQLQFHFFNVFYGNFIAGELDKHLDLEFSWLVDWTSILHFSVELDGNIKRSNGDEIEVFLLHMKLVVAVGKDGKPAIHEAHCNGYHLPIKAKVICHFIRPIAHLVSCINKVTLTFDEIVVEIVKRRVVISPFEL